jgi:3-hydroxyisobutyrate dehydrogenase-like beta-hydroxyacid dehydrogenase
MMATAMHDRPEAVRWLIVGHGSVGSALARRLGRAGLRPVIYDPAPRRPVAGGVHLTTVGSETGTFDVVISCVVPSSAMAALEAIHPALSASTLYLDWNTATPAVKRALAAAAPCAVIDVALMDTLDEEAASPSLAVAGARAEAAGALLSSLGFHVDLAGPECGDAALLKLARSLFMKSLEALVVEFEAALAPLPGREIVIGSIERNLGERFTAFARMLVETSRIHAARRSSELREAAGIFREAGRSVHVAEAAAEVLGAAAQAWRTPDAPPEDAGAGDFARFLSSELPARIRRDAGR